ncbi:FYVE, RhoGEF and PH domain containing 6 [Ectocarpus siliculosus]|uniref:FYVE, RhoGEF and PH domain containing 6 n=1 Tax=Ectocarpus siliculosus TaxID=2880 RepID=D8LL66_ECTSI|nr:FYVE, RhoGEF and PH domain containing 6 [Ectocarpus siliculosus]|eukprot:CBN76126.1 FYVE, RhoGEF and PH domain containing 6 [Ectocarpus siliculosus]
MDDDSSPSCLLCDALFTFTNRGHHCRACLKLVCSACSSNMWKLEAGRSRGYGSAGRRAAFKRVCDKCYGTLVATKEVLVGGDAASLDSGEHVHFEVIVHETLGRAQASRGDAPPSVPVGPSSPRPGAATTGFGVGFSGRATWGEGDDAAAGGGGGAAWARRGRCPNRRRLPLRQPLRPGRHPSSREMAPRSAWPVSPARAALAGKGTSASIRTSCSGCRALAAPGTISFWRCTTGRAGYQPWQTPFSGTVGYRSTGFHARGGVDM